MANVAVLLKMSLLGMWVILLLVPWLSASADDSPRQIKPRKVRCRNPFYGKCFFIWHVCPSACARSCLVDCVACKPVCSCSFPGAVCQDPRFVGGDGITFYFHGRKNQDFCLVSDSNLHINAHFIGKRGPTMKRDFTWVQSIGIIFHTHKLLIAAIKTSTWDDRIDHLSLSFDDMPISLPTLEGSTWQRSIAPLVTITRTSKANGVTVEVAGNFRVSATVVPITAEESRGHGYNITDENCFAHLELGFKFYNLTDRVDGVLGQTYRKNYVSKAKIGVPMPVLGGSHKFSSSNIFATDCKASQFGKNVVLGGNVDKYATLNCKSRMEGNGVVCWR